MVGPACGFRARDASTEVAEPRQEDVVYLIICLFRFFTKKNRVNAALLDDHLGVEYYEFKFTDRDSGSGHVKVLFLNGVSIDADLDICNGVPCVDMEKPITMTVWLETKNSTEWLHEFQRYVGLVACNMIEGNSFGLFELRLNQKNVRLLNYLEYCLLCAAPALDWDDPRHRIEP